ncbi:hypothetical protein [Aerococcus vaginalis]
MFSIDFQLHGSFVKRGGNQMKNYFIKVLNGMAQGLFASLLIGLILE